MSWTCRRCQSPMYAYVGPNGSKATCSSCSQYVDCAQCSATVCGDTKCLKCYNNALAPRPAGKPERSTPIIPEDQEL